MFCSIYGLIFFFLPGNDYHSVLFTSECDISIFGFIISDTKQMLLKSKQFQFIGILEEERKEKKQQADEAAKQIKNLQGRVVCMC